MSSAKTVTIMPRKNSSSISAQDLIKLLDPTNCKTGFLRQKRISKVMKSIKWRHHFVVLTSTALYVYQNEMSKTPDTSINLLGYIAVEREASSTCAWVFSLVPGAPSLCRKSFACSNDSERLDWMQKIKERLYMANTVGDTSLCSAFREKLKLAENLTPEELMYVELELPVIPPDDKATHDTDKKDSKGKNEDGEVDEDDSEEDTVVEVKESSSKFFLPHPDIERKQSFRPSKNNDLDIPDGIQPPRYSAIVGGEEVVYENLGTESPKAKQLGLEVACTILDEKLCRDRDKCMEMLKATKKVGTYLIRKSRKGDYKVLSVLAEEDTVKEYKLEESYGLFRVHHDKVHEFPTVSSLLAYYSHHQPLPNFDGYLGWGVHECGEGQEDLYMEADG